MQRLKNRTFADTIGKHGLIDGIVLELLTRGSPSLLMPRNPSMAAEARKYRLTLRFFCKAVERRKNRLVEFLNGLTSARRIAVPNQ